MRIKVECGTCSQKETPGHISTECHQAKAKWSSVDPTIEEILRPSNFTVNQNLYQSYHLTISQGSPGSFLAPSAHKETKITVIPRIHTDQT